MGLLDRFLKRGKSRGGTNVITHSDFGLYIDGDSYVPFFRYRLFLKTNIL